MADNRLLGNVLGFAGTPKDPTPEELQKQMVMEKAKQFMQQQGMDASPEQLEAFYQKHLGSQQPEQQNVANQDLNEDSGMQPMNPMDQQQDPRFAKIKAKIQ